MVENLPHLFTTDPVLLGLLILLRLLQLLEIILLLVGEVFALQFEFYINVPVFNVVQAMLGPAAVDPLEQSASAKNSFVLDDVVDLIKQDVVELVDHLRRPVLNMQVLLILGVFHIQKESHEHIFSPLILVDQSLVPDLFSDMLVVLALLVLESFESFLLFLVILDYLRCDFIDMHLVQVIL